MYVHQTLLFYVFKVDGCLMYRGLFYAANCAVKPRYIANMQSPIIAKKAIVGIAYSSGSNATAYNPKIP